MRTPTLKAIAIVMALLGSSALHAANMAFMADQAMSRFTTQDAQFFNEAAHDVLKGKEGVEVKWSNPATGAFGTLIAYPDPEKNPACRVVHMVNVAENVKSAGYYRFCKQADGSWPPAMPPRKN